MKAKREPWVWIFAGTAIVMLIAMGIFIWSIVQSSREGARITVDHRGLGEPRRPQGKPIYEQVVRLGR